ncbi:hypothetical protein E2C01_003917 [Portunus trituberculatus]|uniref:Uncharacterized protein n=1 Tax=Portunus trituberculatus TaxID=210409 RepID=A0A5B7CSF5_PORTR|nr:hypothetical protein [Portunus trituberculatus]
MAGKVKQEAGRVVMRQHGPQHPPDALVQGVDLGDELHGRLPTLADVLPTNHHHHHHQLRDSPGDGILGYLLLQAPDVVAALGFL